MKYGESIFDLFYLAFAIISGLYILKKAQNPTQKTMGIATLVLGFGDAFHLVPRVLNYFLASDFTAALGIGKLVTSITMTVFYVLLYTIFLGVYQAKENHSIKILIWVLAIVRIILCLFPQNKWLENSSDMVWGLLRNIPFIALGAVICEMYYAKRQQEANFQRMWLYILLSFLFYIPVAVFASIAPMLGMLMLPKTICYILMIILFRRAVNDKQNVAE